MKAFSNIWARVVRFGFYLLYNQLAFTYDSVSWIVSLGLWREWQRTAIVYISGPRVLEIAHGPGHMLLALNQAGFNVTGIDLSSYMVRLAKVRIGKINAPIDLVRSPVQQLPFQKNTFDSILSTFPSEFILQASTLESVYNVLKPDGYFIIVPAAQLTGTNPIVKGIEWLYYITGQRSSSSVDQSENSSIKNEPYRQLNDLFSGSGFVLEIKKVVVKNSKVTLLLAQKQN